jgi:hypothetical protein
MDPEKQEIVATEEVEAGTSGAADCTAADGKDRMLPQVIPVAAYSGRGGMLDTKRRTCTGAGTR